MAPRWLMVTLLWVAPLGLLRGAAVDPDELAPTGVLRKVAMQYGSVLTYTVGLPEAQDVRVPNLTNLALKGMCIRLGDPDQPEATVCFDTDLLRYYAGWTGGWLDLSRTHLTSSKGSFHALIQGEVRFRNPLAPGWARQELGRDPRALPAGPLPLDGGRYLGFYRHGDRVVIRYRIGDAEILETPGCIRTNGVTVFMRTLFIEKAPPLLVQVCEARDPLPPAAPALGSTVALADGTQVRVIGPGIRAEVVGARIQARLSAVTTPTTFQILLKQGTEAWPSGVEGLGKAGDIGAGLNLKSLCRGGPARWPQPVVVEGRMAAALPAGAYVVDTVPMPEPNPWNSWMRLVAFDFLSDGRAVVSTWSGDVWLVSGLEEKLGRVSWKRFAAGLFEPLGLKVVNDQIFVLCRDQLMRLHDLNGDGEADYYECFNNDTWLSPSYHGFAFDLQTDRAGNFYYARCGQRVDPALPLSGGLVRVTADGTRAELVATGLRAANGLGIGAHDEILCGDNQGNWIPSSRLNWIRPGGFYGYLPHAHREPPPLDYDKPVCWLPMTLDNSSGGQLWVDSDRWGPLSGHWLHTSYGKSALLLVLLDEVNGVKQGGVVRLPLKFDSGIMRARIHPRDGQVWVCGLQGWQTSGAHDGALQRVRYTGKPICLPSALHVVPQGLNITFTAPLEAASAADAGNYAIEQWNYLWSEKYGSPDFSVANPQRQGRDPVDVQSVLLSADGRTISLRIPSLRPVMQMRVRFRIKAADGTPVEQEIYNTINKLALR